MSFKKRRGGEQIYYKKRRKPRYEHYKEQIRIKWINITPRDKILPNLYSGRIYINFTILKDFYLIVKSGELKLVYDTNIEKKINELQFEEILRLSDLIDKMDISEHFEIKNKLAIPGSTLKGVCRSRLELSFLTGNMMPSCFSTKSKGQIGPKSKRHLKAYAYNNNDIPQRNQCRGGEKVCFVCNIFGSMGLRSKLAFSNAIMKNGSSTILDLRVRNGFAHEEVIKPGSKFEFDIYFENMSEVELGALFYVLNLSNHNPILIGSHKYALQETNGEKIKFGQGQMFCTKIEIYKDMFDVVEEDTSDFITKCIEQFRQEYRGQIRELREWEVLPC